MIRAQSLSKTYMTSAGPVPVLRDATFECASGDAVAIVGPSGSGKSTLLNLLGTLERPSGGLLWIQDRNPWELSDRELARFRNQRIGFVFQDHHLLPQCSVLENVLLPTLAGARVEAQFDAVERARELLDRVGLSHRLEHRPWQLSGGEKQRTAIARALIHRPALLLADEPTGNLDRASADEVAQLLTELYRDRDAVLIVVTHSENWASRFPKCFEMIDGALRAR